MPALSFVLVAHREQAWLSGCVASVLGQPCADVEMVAIDDASPDHGPELLDELAERHARLRVEHLAMPLGRGGARNLALDLVQGDYVLFLDPTDEVVEGALHHEGPVVAAGHAPVLV